MVEFWYGWNMNLPIIIVNFKLYEQAAGNVDPEALVRVSSAVELAKVHERVAKETGANIAIAVNAVDLAQVCNSVEIPVFAQHIDPISYGSYTGHVLPEAVRDVGVIGTLLNHAECQIDDEILRLSIDRAKDVGLYVVACANDVEAAEKIMEYGPDLVAVEPPELIGGDVSVSKAEPEVIEKSVEKLGKGKVLVGAGVKNGEDVRIALKLGASGVLLASGVTMAENPYEVLMDLVSGLS
jgi:triosephosphate isomerase